MRQFFAAVFVCVVSVCKISQNREWILLNFLQANIQTVTINSNNNDQSYLVKDGIANRCCHLVNHKLSLYFVKLEAMACFSGGFDLPNLLVWLSGTPSNATCHSALQACQMAFKSVKWFYAWGMNVTDDGQQTGIVHSVPKCVAVVAVT